MGLSILPSYTRVRWWILVGLLPSTIYIYMINASWNLQSSHQTVKAVPVGKPWQEKLIIVVPALLPLWKWPGNMWSWGPKSFPSRLPFQDSRNILLIWRLCSLFSICSRLSEFGLIFLQKKSASSPLHMLTTQNSFFFSWFFFFFLVSYATHQSFKNQRQNIKWICFSPEGSHCLVTCFFQISRKLFLWFHIFLENTFLLSSHPLSWYCFFCCCCWWWWYCFTVIW